MRFTTAIRELYNKLRSKFTVEDQVYFAQRLSFLMSAGIPLVDSLSIMRTHLKDKHKARIFETLEKDVSNGQYLSESMKQSGASFSSFFVHLIYIGETSGTLTKNLEYSAMELKKKHALRRKIRGALFYPVFIICATCGITAVLVFYIFPKIMPVFKSMKIDLPVSTKIVIFLSDLFLSHPLLITGSTLFVAVIYTYTYSKSIKLKRLVERFLMMLPISKKIIINYTLAQFSRTLGLLLQSGIPVGSSLVITSGTLKNETYSKACDSLVDEVNKGVSLTKCLGQNQHIFPSIMVSMVSVGEMTGRLGDTLVYLSEMYEEEVEVFTKTLSTSIEPFLMLFMGCVVGFVALSIITPIYEVTQHLQ